MTSYNDIVSYFTSKGYAPYQAAGIAGNLAQESTLDPSIVNKTSGAFGLAQWLGSRKRQLKQFAQANDGSVHDPRLQLDFIDWELNNTESRARRKLLQTRSPEEAANVFSDHFERAGKNEKNNARRQRNAREALASYTGGSESGGYGGGYGGGFAGGESGDYAGGDSQESPSFDDFVKHEYKPQAQPKQQAEPAIPSFDDFVKNEYKPQEQSIAKTILNTAGDIGLGALQGAGNIGATLMQPIDYAMDRTGQQNAERRRSLTEGLKNLGAETESIPFKAGEFGSEMAGTWAAGGALSKAGKVARYAPELAKAIETGGMAKTALLPRVAGGAISGAVQAGMVNPEDATTGAVLGGALPLVGKAISGVSKLATGGNITPEVRSLAEKAGQYGIDIPVDRILKSKPLNAAAASLEYLPFSGRSETMDKVADQFKIAISKTMGENTSNLAESVNNARQELGKKFDDVLSNNRVVADSTFVNDLLDLSQKADEELLNNAPVIKNQIDKLLNAIDPNGTIDGNGAYEVKKRLDKLSKSNEHGYLANDVKQSLMDALNRSLPADKADDFAKVRKQYQSLLTVEPLVQAGAEGNVSLARFANLHKTGHKQLDELRDISGQFLRTRESPHSAGQRVTLTGFVGALTGALGGIPAIAGTLAAGRGANELLNSNLARKAVLNGVQTPRKSGELASKSLINLYTNKDKKGK